MAQGAIAQARVDVVERLRARRSEIDQAIFARVSDEWFDRTGSGDAAWLLPGSDEELCLLYTVKALTRGPEGRPLPPAFVRRCTTATAATAGHLVVTQSLAASPRDSSAVLILGVAPNGVARVSVISGSERTRVLPVRRNAYVGTVVDPRAVTFSARVGNTTVSRLVPVASFDGPSARPAP
jgi:hypothetical protein